MNRRNPSPAQVAVHRWFDGPIPKPVLERVQRMAASPGVRHVAVMPDAHLANEYCVGTVVATERRIIPQAIGSDIGCGMAAVRLETAADRVNSAAEAHRILELLRTFVPSNKRCQRLAVERLPQPLRDWSLSDSRLDKLASRDGRVQFGSLGRGNHFLEFQSDEHGRLWLMIHSGSRAMGRAITDHHLRYVCQDGPFAFFDAESATGRDYWNDVQWAIQYARENRRAMLEITVELMDTLWSVAADYSSLIESDHNHVRFESHFGQQYWVHRKGAQSAKSGQPGVIPGSMGTASYHVEGRGCDVSLNSSSHGAGRRMSRTEARSAVSTKSLVRQMKGVYFDRAKSQAIRDEAPSAYKDIRRVMKAQRELVKVRRVLQPILSYKGV